MRTILICLAFAGCVSSARADCVRSDDNMRPCYGAGPTGHGVATQRDPLARQGRRGGALPPQSPVTSLGAGRVGAGGVTASVAAAATGPMQCVLDALVSRGYPVRFMRGFGRGSVAGSLHPAGMAMDVNQLSRGVTSPRMPSDEISLANGCGVISGAQWTNNDSGHFQLGGWSGTGRQGHSHSIHRQHRRR